MIRCKRDMVLKAADVWRAGILRRKLFLATIRGSRYLAGAIVLNSLESVDL